MVRYKKGRRNGTVTTEGGGDRGEGGAEKEGGGGSYIAVMVLDVRALHVNWHP